MKKGLLFAWEFPISTLPPAFLLGPPGQRRALLSGFWGSQGPRMLPEVTLHTTKTDLNTPEARDFPNYYQNDSSQLAWRTQIYGKTRSSLPASVQSLELPRHRDSQWPHVIMVPSDVHRLPVCNTAGSNPRFTDRTHITYTQTHRLHAATGISASQ